MKKKAENSAKVWGFFLKNQYTFHAFAYTAYFDLPFILVLILFLFLYLLIHDNFSLMEEKSLHQLAMKWSHLCLKLTPGWMQYNEKRKKTGVNLSKLCLSRRTKVWVKCLIFLSQSLLSCQNHSPWHLFGKCWLVSSWKEFWSLSAQTDTHFQTWTVQVQFHLDLSSDAAVFGDWDASCLLIGQPFVWRYFTYWHDYRQQNHGWWIRCSGLSFLH